MKICRHTLIVTGAALGTLGLVPLAYADHSTREFFPAGILIEGNVTCDVNFASALNACEIPADEVNGCITATVNGDHFFGDFDVNLAGIGGPEASFTDGSVENQQLGTPGVEAFLVKGATNTFAYCGNGVVHDAGLLPPPTKSGSPSSVSHVVAIWGEGPCPFLEEDVADACAIFGTDYIIPENIGTEDSKFRLCGCTARGVSVTEGLLQGESFQGNKAIHGAETEGSTCDQLCKSTSGGSQRVLNNCLSTCK